jgi:PIN domain nuclease of toxin-antitoxin system
VRLLLDTHVLIWLANRPGQVPEAVRCGLAEAEEVFASVISAWEYGLKRQIYPADFPHSFGDLVRDMAEPLDFAFACHVHAERLPPIHKDPFDRMLVAQALHHGLILVTQDDKLRRYPVETLW